MRPVVLDEPGVAFVQQRLEIAGALGLDRVLHLAEDDVLVGDLGVIAVDNPQRLRELRVLQLAEKEREALVRLVVDEHVLFGQAVAELDDLQVGAVHPEAPGALGTEDQRLAVLALDGGVLLRALLRRVEPRLVVVDVAVLVDLDERRPAMAGGPDHRLFQVLDVDVDRTGDERASAADGEGQRVDRVVRRAGRRGLGLLAELAGR